MAKRKKKQNFTQMDMFTKEERAEYSHLPSFTSTPNEIREAVEQSVYNLTRMYEQQEEMGRFLNDMSKFLGYKKTDT